jgi:hypothetical protein
MLLKGKVCINTIENKAEKKVKVEFVAEHFWYICLLGSLASVTVGS